MKADSLAGYPKRPPQMLSGKPGSGEVILIGKSQATISLGQGGETRTATAYQTWRLKVAGDSLTGTVQRSVEGVGMQTGGPLPFSGSRKQS